MQDGSTGDSADLEALFDSVAAEYEAAQDAPQADATSAQDTTDQPADDVHNRLGHLLRHLHDTLHELGYDRSLERIITQSVPDANDRLNYVINMTEQAATRALTAIEQAKPIQETIKSNATGLQKRWDALLSGNLGIEEFKALAKETQVFLADVPGLADQTSAQLMEIMMAQDFQDLTGQVIKRIMAFTNEIEGELAQVLLMSAPAEKRATAHADFLSGPAIKGNQVDVMANQSQVDDLLASLGF